MFKFLVSVFAFVCSSACLGSPAINVSRAVVIQDVITNNNLKPLGEALLEYSAKDASTPVDIVIDSPGGSVVGGFLFLNTMEQIKGAGTPIRCFVSGIAASMAFGILTHCDERYTLEHSFLLWHRARVFGGMAPITAPAAKVLAADLERMDHVIFEETLDALGMPEKDVRYHFENETLHIGANLAVMAPDFIESVQAFDNLVEALAKAPKSQQPMLFGLFGGVFQPGELIYISPYFDLGNQ